MDLQTLYTSIESDDAGSVTMLLNAHPGLISLRNADDKKWDESSPLHCAAKHGQLNIVKLLVERGAEDSAWRRGVCVPMPGGAKGWCRRAVFCCKGGDWGEMIDTYKPIRFENGAITPICKLERGLTLQFRVWADNAGRFRLGIDSTATDNVENYSLIEVHIDQQRKWIDVSVPLDDLGLHREFRGLKLLRMNDPIAEISFKAFREDRNEDTGLFYLDDIKLFVRNSDNDPEEEEDVF